MTVLEEVMAEMFRQEQEAAAANGEVSRYPGGMDREDLRLHDVGEDDEGLAGIENERYDEFNHDGLVTIYEEYDEADGLTFPYEGYDDEDDDGDFLDFDPFPDVDERFVECGWDAECLQNAEDIDFEFVYALHTFVATVEGQANATKGDTMVLLDDSNSYWWLVRVVKDSSIGEYFLRPDVRMLSNSRLCQAIYQQSISRRRQRD